MDQISILLRHFLDLLMVAVEFAGRLLLNLVVALDLGELVLDLAVVLDLRDLVMDLVVVLDLGDLVTDIVVVLDPGKLVLDLVVSLALARLVLLVPLGYFLLLDDDIKILLVDHLVEVWRANDVVNVSLGVFADHR